MTCLGKWGVKLEERGVKSKHLLQASAGEKCQCFNPLFIAADCEYFSFEHDVSLK